MIKLLILLTAIAGVLGAAVPRGLQTQLDGRIVEGHPTSISSFPYQVSLQRAGSHFCGGSIYSEQIIITAAHCLQSASARDLRVRAGSSQWIGGGVYVAVKTFKTHKRFNPIMLSNDIAVIRLNTSLVFSSTIRPIKLATVNPESGAVGRVSGWGTTKSGSVSLPTQLKYVEMKVLTQEECASSLYKYGIRIRPTMICTYQVEKDSCQGDSGGPLVSGNELVGVVSWGLGCALENYPGVYASVAVLREWILNTTASI